MEISKILNPSSASGRDVSKKPEKKPSERQSAASTVGQKEWEEKMKKKGMPTEGLNTFRVKKN